MKKYLIDACILCGLANTKDMHHQKCKSFFKKYSKAELFFPIHCLFEANATRLKRIKQGDFLGLPGKYTLKNKKFIDIDREFFNHCQRKNLFSKFSTLKGSDLIYACIAEIGNYILVTCDNHFNNYANKINILKL